jgi:predicted GIY-YIG superfamily endonuclease
MSVGDLPESPATYILELRPKRGHEARLYTGAAKSLRDRMTNGHAKKRGSRTSARAARVTLVWYALVPDFRTALELEYGVKKRMAAERKRELVHGYPMFPAWFNTPKRRHLRGYLVYGVPCNILIRGGEVS